MDSNLPASDEHQIKDDMRRFLDCVGTTATPFGKDMLRYMAVQEAIKEQLKKCDYSKKSLAMLRELNAETKSSFESPAKKRKSSEELDEVQQRQQKAQEYDLDEAKNKCLETTIKDYRDDLEAVSYTHLTLPTSSGV